MTKLSFNQNIIEEVEKDFQQMVLPQAQRTMVAQAAQVYTKYLPISELAMKGFISLSIKVYQIKNKVDMEKYLEFTPIDQRKALDGIANILKTNLSRLLRKPKQQPILDKAIKEAVSLLN
jgi:hypothetical protein